MFNRDIGRPPEVGTVDAPLGRPRSIRVGDQRLTVTAVEAMRDETAAYPPESGPRQVFRVRAHHRRFRLIHALRDGRWTVEELGIERQLATLAA
jgi:hypothetical protein